MVVAARFAVRAVGPAENVMHAEQDGQKEQRDEWERAIGRGGEAAQRAPPHSSAQKLHHHDDERAERKAAPEEPNEKVRAEKLRVIKERADD